MNPEKGWIDLDLSLLDSDFSGFQPYLMDQVFSSFNFFEEGRGDPLKHKNVIRKGKFPQTGGIETSSEGRQWSAPEARNVLFPSSIVLDRVVDTGATFQWPG